MPEEKQQTNDLENLEKMNFIELHAYTQKSLLRISDEVAQKDIKEGSEIEYEINKLIILLESKRLEGLITKEQKSVKILRKELFRIENRKQKTIENNKANLSDLLNMLYELRNESLETELTQDFFEKSYLQLCKLPAEYFDASKYHKIAVSHSNFNTRIYRLNMSGKEYNDSRKDFSKELPSILDQAIKKIGIYLQKQENLQTKNLTLDDFEERAIDLFNREVDQKSNGEVTKRQQQIVALRSKKRKLFTKSFEAIPVKKLPWKFFPKGEWTVEQIVKEFGKYISQNEIIDESRIWKIYENLRPSDCYISQDGFNRYIVFCFDWTDKVVLECPIYGNAVYIIKDNWKEITKLHKWQARLSHQVTVIHHSDSWFSRLKNNLKSSY